MSVPEIRPSYLVGRIDRLIKTEFEEALADAGLTLAEFTALSVLSARPGLSNARLARRSLVTPQAMNKVVLSLERLGLVERTADASGGRVLGTDLTPTGRRLFTQLTPLVQAAEDRVLVALTRPERKEFVRLLALVANLGPAKDRS